MLPGEPCFELRMHGRIIYCRPSRPCTFVYIIGRAGTNPPSRTNSTNFLIYIRVVRRAQNFLRASFSPIFQYFEHMRHGIVFVSLGFFGLEFVRHGPWPMDPSAIGVGVAVIVGVGVAVLSFERSRFSEIARLIFLLL